MATCEAPKPQNSLPTSEGFPCTGGSRWWLSEEGSGEGGRDLGGEQVGLHDAQPPGTPPRQAEHLLQREEAARNRKPLPEVGAVEEEEGPDGDVGEVGPVEDLRAGSGGHGMGG